MNGSAITVSVNGSHLISTSDSSITSGQAGFYSESAANFDEYYVAPRR